MAFENKQPDMSILCKKTYRKLCTDFHQLDMTSVAMSNKKFQFEILLSLVELTLR